MRGKSILIAGIGNIYRRDDGIGVLVARAIRDRIDTKSKRKSEISVDIVEMNDPSSLIDMLQSYDKVIIIDAVMGNSMDMIGTVHTLSYRDIIDGSGGEVVTSTHTIDLKELVMLIGMIYNDDKDLTLIGIEGYDFGVGEGLSPGLMDRMDGIVSSVMDKVNEIICDS
jgi:hydrogenase maturation protease